MRCEVRRSLRVLRGRGGRVDPVGDVAHDVGRPERGGAGAQGPAERGGAGAPPGAGGREGQRRADDDRGLGTGTERAVERGDQAVAPGLRRGEVAEGLSRLLGGGPALEGVGQDPAAQDVGRCEAGDAQRRAGGQEGVHGEQGRVGQRLAGTGTAGSRG
uniref:Uncharacterized protein n=1 Tax=Myoviridae sp. cte0t5 TaxID=2823549 RepID=A0A8S5LGX8_9CAUD|nr:MAG TPA: hypothetical protein [Myoviridae sp. cte0t5]